MPVPGEWDTRVVWNVRRGRWWWNAWREATGTEVWGFADSPVAAWREMTTAMERADRITPIRDR